MKHTIKCLLVIWITSLPFSLHAEETFKLAPNQQAFVLEHMKSMLETIGQMQFKLAEGKPQEIAPLVQALQKKQKATRPKGIGKSFPDGFRVLSKKMNQHWNNLKQPIHDPKVIHQELNQILNQCNACHRSYQLER